MTWLRILRRAAFRSAALAVALFALPASGQDKLVLVMSTAQLEPGTATLTSLPDALGFWKEEGLEVEIRKAQGTGLAAQMIASGQGDIAHAGTSVGLMQPVAKGVKMMAFYNMIIHNFQMPAVPVDSPIKTLKDLKGKKLGVIGLATATIPIVKAVLEDSGLDPEKDVTFVTVGYGAQAAAAVWFTKQVDGLAMYDSLYAAIENVDPAKYKLRLLTSPLSERISFQTALVAKTETIKAKREAFIKLGRGHSKAMIFALENPDAAVKIHFKRYPEQRMSNVDDATAIAIGKNAMLARLNNMRIDTMAVKRDKWGFMHEVDVKTYLDMLKKTGEIAKEVKAEDIYTNELIDEMNRFDAEKIKAFARNYKAD